MFRVLLVGPYKGDDRSGDSFTAPPFGLYRLKFYIEKSMRDVSVDVLDPGIDDYTDVKGQYQVVGLSPLHLTFENDLKVFKFFKSRYPEALFITGGIEVTFLGKEVFDAAPFDILVLGEGEKVLAKIIKAVQEGRKEFNGIKSIYWRDKGEIRFNGYGSQLELSDYRAIYKAFEVGSIPYKRYWSRNARLYKQPNWVEIHTVRSIFSNYCPFACKFCSSTNFISYSTSGKLGGKCDFHILPVEDVVSYIKKTADSWEDVKTLIFDDDNLTLDIKYLKELCLEITRMKQNGELKRDLSFICQGRIDAFSRHGEKVLDLMKSAGFRMIMYGVESFSDKMLDFLGKRISQKESLKAIDVTLREGIVPLIYIILFPPCITKEDLVETVDMCVEQISRKLEVSTTLLVMDLPGSQFYYDNTLRRKKQSFQVDEKTSFAKSNYIWPSNEDLYALSVDIEENYAAYEKEFKENYGIEHIPGRIYSFIVFDVIYKRFGLEDKRNRLRKLTKDMINCYQ